MNQSAPLFSILILLAAAVVVVAVFRRFNASSVIGYLTAGALVGPGGFSLISDASATQSLSEFGVMLLLFIIGLELSLSRLRDMRLSVWAIAVAQVVVTVTVLVVGLRLGGVSTKLAIIMGGALALSSTALVIQLLKDRQQSNSALGRLCIAILLVQDLAVVPLLTLIPSFAHPELSLEQELLTLFGKAALALGAILLIGRLLLSPVYRLVASVNTPEIVTAFTLLVVLGTGMVTHYAGLSLPLGAFLAGLLMADTEYRHQVEADVLPFKSLFLGLFFMTTGMVLDVEILLRHWEFIFTFAIGSMALKTLILLLICRALKVPFGLAITTALTLSQGGEFAFIVFKLAADNQLMSVEWSHMLTISITLTMMLTSLAMMLGDALNRRTRQPRRQSADEIRAEIKDLHNHVIILGFGRVGQTIAKLLSAEGISYIAVDSQVSTVLRARKIGLPVYYGDGSRKEVLHAIGKERARAAIITLNDIAASERAVRSIRHEDPEIFIIVRARELKDIQMLEGAGANIAISEPFEASLQLGGALLRSLGVTSHEIDRILELFRSSDYALARGTLEVKRGGNPASSFPTV